MGINAVGFYMALLALLCGLAVARCRALRGACICGSESGLFPAVSAISFANEVGKQTFLAVLDVIGWVLGAECLGKKVFQKQAVGYYAPLADLRDKRLLTLRLICVSDDTKTLDSVYMLLKELFPFASISAMDNNKRYRQTDITHPTKPRGTSAPQ